AGPERRGAGARPRARRFRGAPRPPRLGQRAGAFAPGPGPPIAHGPWGVLEPDLGGPPAPPVRDHVARDSEQPCADGAPPRVVAPPGTECPDEGLAGEVFGVGLAGDASTHEPPHVLEVHCIDLLEVLGHPYSSLFGPERKT